MKRHAVSGRPATDLAPDEAPRYSTALALQ